MRYVVCRASEGSPTELSYVTGTITLQEGTERTVFVPSSGWWIAEAFRFKSLLEASTFAESLMRHGAADHFWFPMPVPEIEP